MYVRKQCLKQSRKTEVRSQICHVSRHARNQARASGLSDRTCHTALAVSKVRDGECHLVNHFFCALQVGCSHHSSGTYCKRCVVGGCLDH
jgi:hypothetical protein